MSRESLPAGLEVECVSAPRDSLQPRRGRPGATGAERQGGSASLSAAPPTIDAGMEQWRLGRLISSTTAGSNPAPATTEFPGAVDEAARVVRRHEVARMGGEAVLAKYGPGHFGRISKGRKRMPRFQPTGGNGRPARGGAGTRSTSEEASMAGS